MRYELTDENRVRRALAAGEGEERIKAAPAALYAVFCALFSAIAVFGLFLGYFLKNAPIGTILAGGEPILRGALFGVIAEILRGSIPVPAAAAGLSGGLPLFLYIAVLALAPEVLVSLALTAFAFLRPRASRKLLRANAILVVLSYGIPALGCLLAQSFSAELFSWRQLDLPATIVSLSAATLYFILSLAKRKGRAVLNFVLFLLTLTGCIAFSYPGSELLRDLDGAFLGVGLPAWVRVMLIVALLGLFVNLVLCVLRLGEGGTLLPDFVRFALQLVFSLGVFAAYLASGSTFDFFLNQPIPSLLLTLPPLASFAVAAFGFSLRSKKRAKKG